MFENIGGKMKALARVMAVLGIIGAVVAGVVLVSDGNVGAGLCVAILGSLVAWTGSFFAYGFGQLIENSGILIEQNAILVRNVSEDFCCPHCGETVSFTVKDLQEDPIQVCPFCDNEIDCST